MVDEPISTNAERRPDFERYLFGSVPPASVGMDRITLERRSLGVIEIPDGRVYACDPLVPMDCAPLAQRLAAGQYEVVVFVLVGMEHGTAGGERSLNTAAALLCSQTPVLRWELAAREDGPPDAAAYGVDSGTGSFMGSRALELMLAGDEASGQAIMAALRDTSAALATLVDGSTAAVFNSGIGDGAYDTWLGRDAHGEPAMILTDFQTLASEEYVAGVHAEWAARKAKRWWQFWK